MEDSLLLQSRFVGGSRQYGFQPLLVGGAVWGWLATVGSDASTTKAKGGGWSGIDTAGDVSPSGCLLEAGRCSAVLAWPTTTDTHGYDPC